MKKIFDKIKMWFKANKDTIKKAVRPFCYFLLVSFCVLLLFNACVSSERSAYYKASAEVVEDVKGKYYYPLAGAVDMRLSLLGNQDFTDLQSIVTDVGYTLTAVNKPYYFYGNSYSHSHRTIEIGGGEHITIPAVSEFRMNQYAEFYYTAPSMWVPYSWLKYNDIFYFELIDNAEATSFYNVIEFDYYTDATPVHVRYQCDDCAGAGLSTSFGSRDIFALIEENKLIAGSELGLYQYVYIANFKWTCYASQILVPSDVECYFAFFYDVQQPITLSELLSVQSEINYNVIDNARDANLKVGNIVINSIGQFMGLEILPDLTIFDLLVICLAIPLLIAILKLWLGG